jgi:hypothetical protein
MSFYIYLAMAFGLGWFVRPIIEASRPSDACHEDLSGRFFGDPHD